MLISGFISQRLDGDVAVGEDADVGGEVEGLADDLLDGEL